MQGSLRPENATRWDRDHQSSPHNLAERAAELRARGMNVRGVVSGGSAWLEVEVPADSPPFGIHMEGDFSPVARVQGAEWFRIADAGRVLNQRVRARRATHRARPGSTGRIVGIVAISRASSDDRYAIEIEWDDPRLAGTDCVSRWDAQVALEILPDSTEGS